VVTDTLSVEWRGFYHPHLVLSYKICAGTAVGTCDVAEANPVDGSKTRHTFDKLSLSALQVCLR